MTRGREVEQGWTVPAPPPGDVEKDLWIELEACGLEPRIAPDGRSARFVDGAARTRLDYRGLRAWDAAGRTLTARLSATCTGFAVRVEVAGARYPVTVDPVLGAVWSVDGDQAFASLGYCVAGAGE